MILFLDNYDSFTYNIVQYFEQLQAPIQVFNNDAIGIDDIEQMSPQALVLGPGPGTPDDAGITLSCITHFAGRLPILGVCLGHQAIAQAFGAKIIKAQQVMHGRTSQVYHRQQGVFSQLKSPTTVTRYHSLLIDKTTLPDTLEVTAWTAFNEALDNHNTANRANTQQNATRINDDVNEIMAIRHKDFAIEGVQFHPESILSDSGLAMFRNFLIEHRLINK